MPYGRKARSVRAYQFGALAPLDGWEAAVEQHRLRIRYWNALVELDHERRERRDAIVAAALPSDIEGEDELRAARRAAYRDPAVREQLQALDRELYERQKEIRHALVDEGFYWPNYLDIERHYDVARKRPDPLRFQRFDPWQGRIAFPFTNGLPVAALYGGDNRARIEAVDPWGPHPGRRHDERTRLLRVRVGTDGRQPVWLSLPVILHRPLPANGVVREIGVNWELAVPLHVPSPGQLRRFGETLGLDEAKLEAFICDSGYRWQAREGIARWIWRALRWSVSVVVETPAAESNGAGPEGPMVAVDLCWRQLPDGSLRAGFWLGEDGERGEIALSAEWIGRYRKVQDLRSIRDQHRDALQAELAAWLSRKETDVPAWLRAAAQAGWRSPTMWALLWQFWRRHRFVGDEAGFAALHRWWQRDRHLGEWEARQRTNVLLARREIYRRKAAELSRRYSALRLEEFDLRRVAQDPGRKDLPEQARFQRVLAAPSELRDTLVNAFARDHGAASVIIVPAEYTTRACHACGAVDEGWDPSRELYHTCSRCGATWDQDENACRNLLLRGSGTGGDEPGDPRGDLDGETGS